MNGVVGVEQIGEVGDHLRGRQPSLEDLGACRERQRVQPGQRGIGVPDGLDVQQGLLDEQIEFGGLRARIGGGEHPLADR